mmetsp:Transcript_24681/g.36236  ORF Transcript_24681/g.36236 Transcript_24681/m.36236 type:complete len:260 (+) Transcript_24681:37-816(+)
MSFQDVGKSGRSRTPNRAQLSSQPTIPESSPASFQRSGGGGDQFAQVSDGILQYQRNVGILERIARQVGTRTDGEELQTQYEVQLDVLNQLGEKLEIQLKEQERQLESLPRTEAAKKRATFVKLSRDFRRVENTFKTIKLETRERRARIEEAKRHAATRAAGTSVNAGEEERLAMQMQLQQDRLNEEIMREREEEIRNINKGMHTVNEIYKDLAHIVAGQDEQIGQIATDMEGAKVNAEQGLSHVQKANERASSQCTIS